LGERGQKPALTDTQKAKRLAFARDNLGRDLSAVVFADDKVKLSTRTKKRWAGKNDWPSCATVKHAASLNLVACIGHGGFGCFRCFPQNLAGAMKARFVKDVIAPSVSQAVLRHRRDWVLMHDNDPKYRPKVCQNQVVALGIADLCQPAQSPDLNLSTTIEGL